MTANKIIESLKRENEFLKEKMEWYRKENRSNLEDRLEALKNWHKTEIRHTELFWQMFNDLQTMRAIINQQQLTINNFKK